MGAARLKVVVRQCLRDSGLTSAKTSPHRRWGPQELLGGPQKRASRAALCRAATRLNAQITARYQSGRPDSNRRRPAWEGGGRPKSDFADRQSRSEDVVLDALGANTLASEKALCGPLRPLLRWPGDGLISPCKLLAFRPIGRNERRAPYPALARGAPEARVVRKVRVLEDQHLQPLITPDFVEERIEVSLQRHHL